MGSCTRPHGPGRRCGSTATTSQAFAKGILRGSIDFALQMVTGGRGFRARRLGHSDHECMQPIARSVQRKPTFNDSDSMDKLSDVYLSGSVHEEDQPSHLVVNDPSICVDRCTKEFGNPCQHFCPAAVYEWPGGHPGGRDQRIQLCALQDVRHHGSLPEHRMGRAGGRRRTQVHRHVRRRANCPCPRRVVLAHPLHSLNRT